MDFHAFIHNLRSDVHNQKNRHVIRSFCLRRQFRNYSGWVRTRSGLAFLLSEMHTVLPFGDGRKKKLLWPKAGAAPSGEPSIACQAHPPLQGAANIHGRRRFQNVSNSNFLPSVMLPLSLLVSLRRYAAGNPDA